MVLRPYVNILSFNNVQDSDAIDRMTKGILGEHEGLKLLGISLNEATLQNKMLEMGLSGQFAKLDEVTKAQVRYQVMLDQTVNAQGDAVRSADSYENSVKKLKAGIQNVAEEFGKNLLPLATEIIQAVTPVVENLIPLAGEMGQALADGVKQGIDKLQELGDSFQEVGEWMKQHQDLCIAVGLAVGTLAIAIGLYNVAMNWMTVSTYVGVTALTVWEGVCGLATAVTTALGSAVAFLMSPFGLVAMAIIGVIGIGYLLIKNWDLLCEKATQLGNWVKDKVVGGFEWCKEKASEIWQNVCDFVGTAWDTICNLVSVGVQLLGEIIGLAIDIIFLPWRFIWENCKDFIIPIFESIATFISDKMSQIGGWIGEKLTQIYDWFSEKFTAVRDFCTDIWGQIRETVVSKVTELKENVTRTFEMMKQKIEDRITQAKARVSQIFTAMKTVVSTVVSSIKTAVVDKFNEIKTNVQQKVDGIKTSVTNTFNKVKDALWKPIESAREKIKGVFDKIKGIFNTQLKPNIKLPHLKISGKFSLNPPSVPKFGIEWYQTGGIFTGASVIGVGENGDEAVVPLSNKRRMKPFASAVASMIDGIAKNDTAVSTGTTINISQMVVREEADIKRIAEELEKLTARANRKRGIV